MANQQAIDYIRQQTSLGVSREAITAGFIAQGWQQGDIDDAFNSLSYVPPMVVEPKSNRVWRIVSIILGSIILIFIILVIIGINIENQTETNNPSLESDKNSVASDLDIADSGISFTLLGNTYRKGFTLPGGGVDFSSEGYEWVSGKESVNNWKTLVTTHKLFPLSADKPISAKLYAGNILSMHKESGAFIIENFVVDGKKATEAGIDASKPVYVIIYAFPGVVRDGMIEFDIQRIQDTDDGGVTSFIYAKKIMMSSPEDLNKFTSTKEYNESKTAVVMSKFPY